MEELLPLDVRLLEVLVLGEPQLVCNLWVLGSASDVVPSRIVDLEKVVTPEGLVVSVDRIASSMADAQERVDVFVSLEISGDVSIQLRERISLRSVARRKSSR